MCEDNEVACSICGAPIKPSKNQATLFASAEGDPICRSCIARLHPDILSEADLAENMLKTRPEEN